MNIKGYQPALPDPPVPYLDDFNLCETFGWSWDECQNTPLDVREIFLLVLEARDIDRRMRPT